MRDIRIALRFRIIISVDLYFGEPVKERGFNESKIYGTQAT